MLFGSERLQRQLLDIVHQCEQERGVKVIYGAVMGSISRGLQIEDSDYDVRFLYIKDSFPKEILYPDKLAEEELLFRCTLQNACFEQIPFWEATSFMQYMAKPAINGRFSIGLYHAVGRTLFSPYVWDPYGIQPKIMPFVQKCFHKEYCICFYKEMLEKRQWDSPSVNAKEYLNALCDALSMNYVKEYQEFPPIYLPALLQTAPDGVYDAAMQILGQLRKEAREYVKEHHIKNACHHAGSIIRIERKLEIDKYIKQTEDQFCSYTQIPIDEEKRKKIQKQIKGIYNIIQRSMQEEPILEM